MYEIRKTFDQEAVFSLLEYLYEFYPKPLLEKAYLQSGYKGKFRQLLYVLRKRKTINSVLVLKILEVFNIPLSVLDSLQSVQKYIEKDLNTKKFSSKNIFKQQIEEKIGILEVELSLIKSLLKNI